MAKTSIQNVTQTTSNIGPSQLPYYQSAMQGAQSLLTTPYQRYEQDRIAGFTPQQQQVQQNIQGMQSPGQFGAATTLATAAGLGSLQAGQYAPGQFGALGVQAPGPARDVQSGTYNAPQMQAAQTGYAPQLQTYQMQGPQSFGGQQAQQYMSPFIQQALEPQMREAIRGAKQGQLAQDLGAARMGTYGGSRQLLATTERERNLGQQLGDIYGRGMQSAYENAQSQFERDRAAGMQAGSQNLQAALGVQQLGTETGLRTSLANLDAASQANVQNLAAQLQTQGLTAEQAMRAALANQQSDISSAQMGLQAGIANQQQDLEAQRLAEQSRQFGSSQGLAALGQAGQMGQTLTNIGQAQQNADISRLGMQQGTAAQQQELNQRFLDTHYGDFQRESEYPYQQYQRYMNLLSGVPQAASSTSTTSAPSQSLGSQIMQAGLGGLSMARMVGGI